MKKEDLVKKMRDGYVSTNKGRKDVYYHDKLTGKIFTALKKIKKHLEHREKLHFSESQESEIGNKTKFPITSD